MDQLQQYLDRAFQWMQVAIDRTPWAPAGLLLAAAVAVLLAYPTSRLLRSNPIIVGLLLASVGFALVFTLTPTIGEVYNSGHCYLKFSQPTRADLVAPTDVSLNILLFVPTGILIVLLRPLGAIVATAVLAMIIPVAVEWIQLVQTELGRTCSALDIATNELGLLVGLGIGALVRIVWEVVRATTNRIRN